MSCDFTDQSHNLNIDSSMSQFQKKAHRRDSEQSLDLNLYKPLINLQLSTLSPQGLLGACLSLIYFAEYK